MLVFYEFLGLLMKKEAVCPPNRHRVLSEQVDEEGICGGQLGALGGAHLHLCLATWLDRSPHLSGFSWLVCKDR